MNSNKMYNIDILLENRWKIIDSQPKFKRNLENVYDYSSPGQLLLILGIVDINLDSPNQKR